MGVVGLCALRPAEPLSRAGTPMTALRRRGLELACLALGVVVLAGTVWVIGIDTLVGDLRLIGWGLAVILLVESLSVILHSRRLGPRLSEW